MPELDDDDTLDGCDIDFAEFAVDDEVAEYLPLFPDAVADEAKASEWIALGEALAVIPDTLPEDVV